MFHDNAFNPEWTFCECHKIGLVKERHRKREMSYSVKAEHFFDANVENNRHNCRHFNSLSIHLRSRTCYDKSFGWSTEIETRTQTMPSFSFFSFSLLLSLLPCLFFIHFPFHSTIFPLTDIYLLLFLFSQFVFVFLFLHLLFRPVSLLVSLYVILNFLSFLIFVYYFQQLSPPHPVLSPSPTF